MTFALNEDQQQDLNRRLLSYLRGRAERNPSSKRTGPFLATFDEDDNIYLNYAIPDDACDPGPDEIAALIALYEQSRRKPRLEYIPAAAPKLEAALLAVGFTVEARVPIMLCLPGTEIRTPPVDGLEIFAPSAEDDLTGADAAQAEAYGSPPRGPRGHKRTLRFGGVVAAARDVLTGAIVGAGIATPPVNGISEIAGIGVRPAFRRRGAAGAITALLAREAFAKGIALLWLTPGGQEAERIYARAGFVTASEALHVSR